MMIIKNIFLTFSILIFSFFQPVVLANTADPFTRSLGNQNEKIALSQDDQKNKEDIAQNDQLKKNTSQVSTPIINDLRIDPIGNNLSPDPLISYDLVEYRLKGTALSSIHKMKKISFNRNTSLSKIDYGKIPTTHIIKKNDTSESIAVKYGFSPKEIKITNSFVPGSKLIIGNKIILPSRFHVVQKNQNLEMIAGIYKIEEKNLIGLNNLGKNYELKINEKLLLPFYLHQTKKIQTIQDIANLFSRTKNEILKINNLKSEDVLDKGQQVKIPIFVNFYEEDILFNKRGVVNYSINPRNLAILEINNQQYMVREGDLLGNQSGRIVEITSKGMKVLENQEEFIFQINAPITVQQVASLSPANIASLRSTKETKSPEDTESKQTEPNRDTEKNTTANSKSSTESTSVTNVEDLFK